MPSFAIASRGRLSRIVLTAALVALTSVPLVALDAKLIGVGVASTVVHAAIELKGVFKAGQKRLIEDGGTLYVRVQTELWEDRPMWDRLVGPMRVSTFRIRRERGARTLTVADPAGTVTPYPDYPDAFAVTVEVVPADRLQEEAHYYLQALATVGASAEATRDVGDIVFGNDDDASGLAAVGKLVVRAAQHINEYLQNTSAEVTSRKLTGKQIKAADVRSK